MRDGNTLGKLLLLARQGFSLPMRDGNQVVFIIVPSQMVLAYL